MREDQQSYGRASGAALVGLVTQVVLTLAVALLGVYAQSNALQAMTWYFLGGLAIWAVLWLVYKQHQSERTEALEAEQLARADARTAALFEEAGQQLQAARKRLESFYKYLLPGVSLGLGLYLLGVGGVLGYQAWQAVEQQQWGDALLGDASAVAVTLTAVIVGFLAFLVSRYVAGMTQVRAWELLRGGAGYLMGNAAVALLGAVASLMLVFGVEQGLVWLSLLVPAVMVVLGGEMVLNFVLGIYRPRRAGEMPRPALDSRLLGWLTRPESLGKIVSETLNYQFGFEISRSWFYRLLARAVTPLIATAIVVLMVLSSFVVVAPQQQAIVTTFGTMGEQPRVLDAGLHVKWPWPIGRVEKHDVHRVRHVLVGSKSDPVAEGTAILWTNEHVEQEESFLLTAPAYVDVAERVAEDSPLGELVGAQLQVNYWISDVVAYARTASEPDALVRLIAEREVNAFFAQHTIDELLQQSQRQAPAELEARIGRRLEQAGVGLEVVSVNLLGIHPPQPHDVAAAFHERINVLQESATMMQAARRESVSMLAEVAGSETRAQQIQQADRRLEQLRDELERLQEGAEADGDVDEQAIAELEQAYREQQVELDQLVERAGGQAASMLHAARADRWDRALSEQAEAHSFASHLALYEMAPRYYMVSAYLEMLGEELQEPRKYIFAAEHQVPPLIRLELDDRQLDFDTLLQEQDN